MAPSTKCESQLKHAISSPESTNKINDIATPHKASERCSNLSQLMLIFCTKNMPYIYP